MRAQIEERDGLRDRYALIRRFGYGVPSYSRATASAQSHLALVTQATIQPYQRVNGQKKFKVCHFYALPWPRASLEELGEAIVRLKVTLISFISFVAFISNMRHNVLNSQHRSTKEN